jgi:cytidylate kinase
MEAMRTSKAEGRNNNQIDEEYEDLYTSIISLYNVLLASRISSYVFTELTRGTNIYLQQQ